MSRDTVALGELAMPQSQDTSPHALLLKLLEASHKATAKHGDNLALPNGTGSRIQIAIAELKRNTCDLAAAQSRLAWAHILEEECAEVLAEADPARLRAELLDVGATVIRWIEALDSRSSK